MPCSLKVFAENTQVSASMLSARGAAECRRHSASALWFPCFDERGEIGGEVVCLVPPSGVHGGQWDRSRAVPVFGLDALPEARARGELVVTGNEVDALTLHHRGVPAVAICGDGTGVDWEKSLMGVDRLLVLRPAGGELPVFLGPTPPSVRERVFVVSLVTHPSVLALHRDTDADWLPSWSRLVDSAVSLADCVALDRDSKRLEVSEACADLLAAPDVLERFEADLDIVGFAGDTTTAKILFLTVVSRLLPRPVSAVVKGPSAAGKSFVVKSVLRFLPDTEYHALTAMSERALIYDDETLQHRVLILQEAAGLGSVANLIVRSLLSEGRIDYQTVQSVDGELRSVRIVREGPTSLITTTTGVLIHRENETRVISLTVEDTDEQTRRVMQAIANEDLRSADMRPWHALQEFLRLGPAEVSVPFAGILAEATEVVAVRMRRDFSNVLGLVRAHALLHQEQRVRDDRGRVIAAFSDYAAVRSLLEDILSDGLERTVSVQVAAVVRAVGLLYVPGDDGEGVTVAKVATHLGVDRSTAHRQVSVALEREFIRNVGGRGRGGAKLLVPGEPLPASKGTILPSAHALERMFSTGVIDVAQPPEEQMPLDGVDEHDEAAAGLEPWPF